MKNFINIILIIGAILGLVYFFVLKKSPVMKADIDSKAFETKQCTANYKSGRLKINAVYIEKDTTIITIDLNAERAGSFRLNSNDPQRDNTAAYYIRDKVFASTRGYQGNVTITKFDLNKKELSGIFMFDAVQIVPYGKQTVKVNNGSFEYVPIKME